MLTIDTLWRAELSAKYYTKRILKGIGKFLYYFGIGLWSITKSFGKNIGIAYRNYQERQRIEEIRRAHYRGIYEENYAASSGWTRAQIDAQNEDRIRRQNERERRDAQRRFEDQMFPRVNENLFDVPKVNKDFFTEDLEPRKRKKRRQMFDL